MRVLLVNKFLYPKGGDAISTLDAGKLLRENGHDAFFWGMDHPANPSYPHKELFISNIDYDNSTGLYGKVKSAANILYSFEAKNKFKAMIRQIKPDIVHLNNFAHQISPSVLHVLREYGIPAVMTMHDYKLACPSYIMRLNGKTCMECKNGAFYHCTLHKCTRGSLFKSMINTAEMYLHHAILNIYSNIDTYIAPSKFMMETIRSMGFQKRVAYLPNYVEPGAYTPEFGSAERIVLYLGRIAKEKGLATLVSSMKGRKELLHIVGEGPMQDDLMALVREKKIDNIRLLGYKSGNELRDEIRKATCIVVPSECNENNPRVVLEAFASGKPVIGARVGGVPELVVDGITGYTFESGNSRDLQDKLDLLMDNQQNIVSMGQHARKLVEDTFNSKKHYKQLMEIYTDALRRNRNEDHIHGSRT